MKCESSPVFRLSLKIFSVILLFSLPAFAEQDPNPNSPSPILISEPDSTRALTNLSGNLKTKNKFTDALNFNSKATLYVTNVDLLNGEGANAFRVYAEDERGRIYRFPVLDLEPLKDKDWIYALTVLLRDESGFREQPPTESDFLISVAWRGLVSNQVKLAVGRTGGKITEDKSAQPTPLKMFLQKPVFESETDYAGYRYSGDRKRFMEQATFGPTEVLDQRLRRVGLLIWLNEQFDAPYPGANNPYPDLELRSSIQVVGCSIYLPDEERRICDRDYYSMYPLQNWFFREALYGDAQLRHRVAWALSQIWVIAGGKTQQSSHMIAYHKVLSRNAFGNYRDLMREMTLNPGMGNYLDMVRSGAFSPNENYARELLQLFSIGLFMLNQDGTLQLDQNGQPIPTYNQETVNNFSKVFTGWTYCNDGNNPACPSAAPGLLNYKDPMILNQDDHHTGAKTLLNYPNAVHREIPAGQNGNTDLTQALDNVFHHPNVAPFVSRRLIQHLVTSDPSPAYIGRVAAVFNNNGAGVRGDLRAVVRAILIDPEARGDKKTDPFYGKLREPVQYATNLLRHFDVRSADRAQLSDGVITSLPVLMGQNPFNSNTVFNYYPPDYIVPRTTLNAPEFGVMTTTTAIARTNVCTTLIYGTIPVGQDIPLGTSIDFNYLTQLAAADSSGNRLMDELSRKLMHGTMSAPTRERILSVVTLIPFLQTKTRAQTALFLTASSSQYQIQR